MFLQMHFGDNLLLGGAIDAMVLNAQAWDTSVGPTLGPELDSQEGVAGFAMTRAMGAGFGKDAWSQAPQGILPSYVFSRCGLCRRSKAFILLVIMANHLPGPHTSRDYTVLEFFSGTARISRLAKARGYQVAAMDILYDSTTAPPRTKTKKEKARYPNTRSAMDLNTSAGFMRLAC